MAQGLADWLKRGGGQKYSILQFFLAEPIFAEGMKLEINYPDFNPSLGLGLGLGFTGVGRGCGLGCGPEVKLELEVELESELELELEVEPELAWVKQSNKGTVPFGQRQWYK